MLCFPVLMSCAYICTVKRLALEGWVILRAHALHNRLSTPAAPSAYRSPFAMQDDIYKADYYLSLMDFRELTLQRLKHFVDQHFFSVKDYLQGKLQDPQSQPLELLCILISWLFS